MAKGPITFQLVPNLGCTERHAIGFLEGAAELTAAEKFRTLSPAHLKYLLHSMGRWINGQRLPQERGHKFEGEYKDAIVFKDVQNQHRFYGFTCNPQPKSNPRFHVSALTNYAQKKENRTDPIELKRAAKWMKEPASMIAIRFVFPDDDEGATQ